jgi:uncharacterized protein YndB with AHSA1/START domain
VKKQQDRPMTTTTLATPDPALDLMFERIAELPPEALWCAWTTPDLLKRWFTPAPWQTVECNIDLRPGGRFSTVMRSPEGQEFPNLGCYLEVSAPRRLVWSNALAPGWRPIVAPQATPNLHFHFTAIITFEPHPRGTAYAARVLHGDPASRDRHDQMGFQSGWGVAFDQLIALMKARA